MFFRPRFRTGKRLARRGFRLRGNTLILLFGFFLVGLFLHYRGRTEPVVAFWNDVRSILGIGRSAGERRNNPYKNPEPRADKATDGEATSEASDENGGPSAEERTANNSEQRTSDKLFDFEKQVDFLLPDGQTDAELVRHDGYVLRYDADLKNAVWVAYPLLAYEITGDADRDNERFTPDRAVDGGTALPSDYTRSGYDRGHLAPAGDFKFSQSLTRQSFLMSNISPQAPPFNRGVWKELEEQVRKWALRDGGLYVVTGPIPRDGLPTIGKTNDVAVPDQFYKVLLYCRKGDSPDLRMIGFLLKNEASDESLRAFVVPVSAIERSTGLDFFNKMPADLQQRLKNQSRSAMVDAWF